MGWIVSCPCVFVVLCVCGLNKNPAATLFVVCSCVCVWSVVSCGLSLSKSILVKLASHTTQTTTHHLLRLRERLRDSHLLSSWASRSCQECLSWGCVRRSSTSSGDPREHTLPTTSTVWMICGIGCIRCGCPPYGTRRPQQTGIFT